MELSTEALLVEAARSASLRSRASTHCVKTATSTWVWALARPDDLVDSTRAALAALNAFACSPVQRLAW